MKYIFIANYIILVVVFAIATVYKLIKNANEMKRKNQSENFLP